MFKYKSFSILLALVFIVSCASRKLKKDYEVVDASHQEVPEWVNDLEEWIDDEEEDAEKNRYYLYETEAKNSRSTACEIAKARSAANVASEISTYIKQSFAQSKHGDPTKTNEKLAEYVQDDLAKEVQAFIVGARPYKVYWEKRKFMKDKGADKDWNGFICASLIKISKTQLKSAFARTEESLAKKVDDKARENVQKILKEAAEAYTQES
ncbi:MAG: hypothetical protein CME62_03300 [Halobacteriovoraceae bacterium]|nr:hypothetical protein [Halobacteriovoraceae bacterium]|tara:strand:+ start:10086 stop:10715 length:630 start_codon:yes stop_codon:yes gene_type:complete